MQRPDAVEVKEAAAEARADGHYGADRETMAPGRQAGHCGYGVLVQTKRPALPDFTTGRAGSGVQEREGKRTMQPAGGLQLLQ